MHFYCKRHIQSKRFRPRCPEFSWFAKNPNRSDHQPRRRMRPVALTSALLLMLTRPQSKSKDDLNGNVQESQYGHNMLEAAFWPVQCSFVNLDLRPSSDWHDSISHIYVCRTLSDDCPRAGRVRRTPKDGQEDERIEDDVSCFVNLLPLLLSKNLRFRSSSSRITKILVCSSTASVSTTTAEPTNRTTVIINRRHQRSSHRSHNGPVAFRSDAVSAWGSTAGRPPNSSSSTSSVP